MRGTVAIRESVEALKRRLSELDREQQTIRSALAALAAVDHGEVVTRHKANGKDEIAVEAPSRTYSYRFTATCAMCQKEFVTARVIKNPKKRMRQYCHQPCTSGRHRSQLMAETTKAQAHEATRGKTLIKGDPLKAATAH